MHQDHEVHLAKSELYKIAKYAIKLHDMLDRVSEEQGIAGWQQAKITKAADYISSVYHRLDYSTAANEPDPLEAHRSASSTAYQYKESLASKLHSIVEIEQFKQLTKSDVDRFDFDEFIGQTKRVSKLGGYQIHQYTSANEITFLVKDPNSEGFLGMLRLNKSPRKFYYSEIALDPSVTGKGLALALYKFVIVKLGYTIVSDSLQSPGGEIIWRKLAQSNDVFVYAWNYSKNKFFQWEPDVDPHDEVYFDPAFAAEIKQKYSELEQDARKALSTAHITQQQFNKMMIDLENQKNQELDNYDSVRFSNIRLVATAKKGLSTAESTTAGSVATAGNGFVRGIGSTMRRRK